MSDHYDLSPHHAPSAGLVPCSGAERLAGVVAHGSMLLAMPLIWPVAVFCVSFLMGAGGRYARSAALQALFFQLLVTIVGGGMLSLSLGFFGLAWITGAVPLLGLILGPLTALLSWPAALLFAVIGGLFFLWGIWIEAVATWKSFNGDPYRMPIVGGLGG